MASLSRLYYMSLRQVISQTSSVARNTTACPAVAPAIFNQLTSQTSIANSIMGFPRITADGSFRLFSTSVQKNKNMFAPNDNKLLAENDVVYPPRKPGLPPRPAEICHMKELVVYSRKKLWYLSLMIRGKSIDEALKQLQFYSREKGAKMVMEIIKEAQDIAVRSHNVEYKSNLWIEQIYAIQGPKQMAQAGQGRRAYFKKKFYSALFIRLREGKPPKEYYKDKLTGQEKFDEYIEKLRNRKVIKGL